MASALYRRYRPESFSEMIGQAHVTEPLMTALRAERIGHAYLFSGPRGCGKTTSARILARCLNCAEGPTDTPCGKCESCVELSRDGGGSLDVVEIDAASHGGIEDARDLRERAAFAPARDRYKIYIIDEAHMVTTAGFNALLKIVEEPPPHVKFIFATTEPDKVIGTIRSRTHHYPFRLIAPGALHEYVQQLCESEGVQVEDGVLSIVVRAGGGSVRDTLSILDQLIAGSENGVVTLDRATGLLGFTSSELIDEVVTAIGEGDSAAAFAAVDRVIQTGQDPRRFVEDLLERMRDLIVISATTVHGAAAVFRGVPETQLQRMFEQSQLFARGQLSFFADIVSAALDSMVGATAPKLQLELMIARALRGAANAATSAASVSVQEAQPAPAQGAQPAPAQGAQPAPAQGAQPAPAQEAQPAPAQEAQPAPRNAAPAVDVIATMQSARDFLNKNAAERPPMVPLGGHAPSAHAPSAHTVTPAAQPGAALQSGAQQDGAQPGVAQPSADKKYPAAPTTVSATEQPSTPSATSEAVSVTELQELWPELLDELRDTDAAAYEAVRHTKPLELDGDKLTIGIVDRPQLETFKAQGAGPLREAISAALGITVTYLPRQIPAASRTSGDAAPTPVPEPEAAPEEPAPSANTTNPTSVQPQTSLAPDSVRDAAPASGAVPNAAANSAANSADKLGAVDDAGADEDAGAVDATDGAASDAVDDDAAQQTSVPQTAAAASINRYGEAVVREVLGARFVEERPLPENFVR